MALTHLPPVAPPPRRTVAARSTIGGRGTSGPPPSPPATSSGPAGVPRPPLPIERLQQPATPDQAPSVILLPAGLQAEMDELWLDSSRDRFADGDIPPLTYRDAEESRGHTTGPFSWVPGREYAALIERYGPPTSPEVALVHRIAGDARSVPIPQPEDHTGGERMGSFHTHPLDESRTAATMPAFSGTDIGSFIEDRELVSVVQQGEQRYLMLRTGATSTVVDRDDVDRFLDAEIAEQRRNGLSLAAAHEHAMSTLAQQYGFAFYAGSGGELRRLSP